LGCTLPGGPGTARALSLHPSGLCFVAAERGLFVTDAEHDVLDAPSQRDGVPQGRPVGAHADAKGRVWLLTDEQFGVVDPRLFCGRTFTGADGLPPGPYRALAATPDGRLVITTGDGAFAYRPDRGPPPAATLLGVAEGAVVRGRAGGSAELELRASARGGGTLRFRRVHH